MEPDPATELSDDELADLARLVDGTLPAERRADLEARVAASAQLSNIVERQRMAVDALHGTADTGAPVRLRAQVERRRAPAAARGRLALGGLAAATLAVALAVVLLLPGPFSGGPSVADAAAFGAKAPCEAAPRTSKVPQLLQADVGGVSFPNYAAKFGWKPIGARHDRAAGRRAITVFYAKDGRTIAYTIVSGATLDAPSHATSTRRGGVEYRALEIGGRNVVTWKRGGHTCVLSGSAAAASELIALADWRGKGTIRF
jgi:anti-sigma factor RsiW